jgi:hypothetical protein
VSSGIPLNNSSPSATPASALETARQGNRGDQTLQPAPALRRLDRLVGTWTMEGNLVGSHDKNIRARRRSSGLRELLPRAARPDRLLGQQIEALELIGYDPETDTFPRRCSPGSRLAPTVERDLRKGPSAQRLPACS